MQHTTTLFAKLEEALRDQIRSDQKFGSVDLTEAFPDIHAWTHVDEAVAIAVLTPSEEERLVAIASLVNELMSEAETIAQDALRRVN